jgi:hypothetical protein
MRAGLVAARRVLDGDEISPEDRVLAEIFLTVIGRVMESKNDCLSLCSSFRHHVLIERFNARAPAKPALTVVESEQPKGAEAPKRGPTPPAPAA